jgi:acylphosphatase
MEKAFVVRVKGRVTGIGFRYSAIMAAEKFPTLKGYVKNISHSEVEAFIQGEEKDLEGMVQWLAKGPPMAKVYDISVNPAGIDPSLTGFGVR